MFLRNVLSKYYPSFEENNNFINCQMLCWIIQFVKFVVQGVKNISYFPEPVIMWVITVRRVVIVFKVNKSSDVEKPVTNHYLRVKQSEMLFFSAPVIFQTIMLIMTHLNYYSKKLVQFLHCDIRLLCYLTGFI